MFAQFARVSVELLLLRRGPQDMPSEWPLLVGLGLAYCSLTFAQVSLVTEPGTAIAQSGLATIILVAYVNAVLRFREVPARFVQTMTSIFTVGIIVTVLMLGPTSALVPYLTAVAESGNPETAPQPPALAMLAYLLVGVWGLVVYGHIYRHALDVSKWMGLGAALLFEIVLFLSLGLVGAGTGQGVA